jgi:hypothetical protein
LAAVALEAYTRQQPCVPWPIARWPSRRAARLAPIARAGRGRCAADAYDGSQYGAQPSSARSPAPAPLSCLATRGRCPEYLGGSRGAARHGGGEARGCEGVLHCRDSDSSIHRYGRRRCWKASRRYTAGDAAGDAAAAPSTDRGDRAFARRGVPRASAASQPCEPGQQRLKQQQRPWGLGSDRSAPEPRSRQAGRWNPVAPEPRSRQAGRWNPVAPEPRSRQAGRWSSLCACQARDAGHSRGGGATPRSGEPPHAREPCDTREAIPRSLPRDRRRALRRSWRVVV